MNKTYINRFLFFNESQVLVLPMDIKENPEKNLYY
jgi:hypothetical protein